MASKLESQLKKVKSQTLNLVSKLNKKSIPKLKSGLIIKKESFIEMKAPLKGTPKIECSVECEVKAVLLTVLVIYVIVILCKSQLV